MRKLLSVVLIIIMLLLSLSGCGSGKETQGDAVNPTNNSVGEKVPDANGNSNSDSNSSVNIKSDWDEGTLNLYITDDVLVIELIHKSIADFYTMANDYYVSFDISIINSNYFTAEIRSTNDEGVPRIICGYSNANGGIYKASYPESPDYMVTYKIEDNTLTMVCKGHGLDISQITSQEKKAVNVCYEYTDNYYSTVDAPVSKTFYLDKIKVSTEIPASIIENETLINNVSLSDIEYAKYRSNFSDDFCVWEAITGGESNTVSIYYFDQSGACVYMEEIYDCFWEEGNDGWGDDSCGLKKHPENSNLAVSYQRNAGRSKQECFDMWLNYDTNNYRIYLSNPVLLPSQMN